VIAEKPTLFMLFILSHGKADGKIQTHHLLDEHDPKKNYETFTTESVFRALKENAFLKDALKLVFLGVSILSYAFFKSVFIKIKFESNIDI
jgi:hypothetical protein